jgi:hypothetical protein
MPESGDKYGLLIDSQKRTADLVEDLIHDFRSLQTINERLALLTHRLTSVEDYVKQLEAFKRDCVTIRRDCAAHISARMEDIIVKREKRGEEMHMIQTKCIERGTELMRQISDRAGALYDRINTVQKELSDKLDNAVAASLQDRDNIRNKVETNENALRDKLATFASDTSGKFGKYSGYAGILPLVVGLLMALLQVFLAHVLHKPTPGP